MMRNRKNITGINTRITVLADIIQKARVVLCADNERIYLNAEETRKIILICLIFYRTKNITFPCETINLKYILSAIKMNDLNIFELSFNDNLQTLELAGALNELSHIDQEPDYLELINYALEALEYDTDVYFNVKVSRGTRNSNSKKKDSGIYYTPLDVANFIVSQCVDTALSETDMPSVLDCSCGTGVFLIQSLCHMEYQKKQKSRPWHIYAYS